MAQPKYDFVVEAVHYRSKGEIAWIRGYERRGPTFSDLILVPREQLIERLKSGKIIVAGRRIPQMASTFQVTHHVRLEQSDGREYIVSGKVEANMDYLDGVPVV